MVLNGSIKYLKNRTNLRGYSMFSLFLIQLYRFNAGRRKIKSYQIHTIYYRLGNTLRRPLSIGGL